MIRRVTFSFIIFRGEHDRICSEVSNRARTCTVIHPCIVRRACNQLSVSLTCLHDTYRALYIDIIILEQKHGTKDCKPPLETETSSIRLRLPFLRKLNSKCWTFSCRIRCRGILRPVKLRLHETRTKIVIPMPVILVFRSEMEKRNWNFKKIEKIPIINVLWKPFFTSWILSNNERRENEPPVLSGYCYCLVIITPSDFEIMAQEDQRLCGHFAFIWPLGPFCYDKTLDQRKIYETEKNINNLFALIVSRPSYGSIISKLTVLEKYSLQFFVFLTSLRQSTEVSALVRSLCFFRCLHLAITSVLLFNKFVSG